MDLKHMIKRRSIKFLEKLHNMDMMFEAYLTHESGVLEPDDIPRTNNPVWILGKQYNAVQDLELIRRDITSRLWFTYRKGFVPIGDSGHTSDKGWGCMLRCGQMVIAQALLFLHLGRDWQWDVNSKEESYLKILKMFEDRRTAPYSIHQIALTGASEGKAVGEWFGPNTVAQVLKKLAVYDDWSSIVFHVALDNTLVVSQVSKLCTTTKRAGAGPPWKPLVLIIPLRLGITDINPVYISGIKKCLEFPQSLGVIGGKPNHALYFIGYVGNDVIFLDPHTNQNIGSVYDKELDSEKKLDATYHCPQANRLHILHMDPSIAVCFLCKTESEFTSLCSQIRSDLRPEPQPLFELIEDPIQDWEPQVRQSSSSERGQHPVGVPIGTPSCSSVRKPRHGTEGSDDDFEFLG